MKLGKLAIVIFTVAALPTTSAYGQSRLLLIDMGQSSAMDHPLYGDVPNAPQRANFEHQDLGDFQVSLRATASYDGKRPTTAVLFIIKNLSADKTITIKPLVDVVDGGNQVLPVLTYRQLVDAVRSSPSQPPSQGGFFAYGSQKFVAQAWTGYTIGSLIAESLRANASDTTNKVLAVYQKHWLKDEYRIPPLAQIDAIFSLHGVPRLPLTTRMTIGDNVFKFVSAASEADAAAAYERERGDIAPSESGKQNGK